MYIIHNVLTHETVQNIVRSSLGETSPQTKRLLDYQQ